jgi:hypothetical protein
MEVSFSQTTSTESKTVIVEEQSYNVVKINGKYWLKENLNVVKFRNGDLIPEARTNEEWKKTNDEGKPAWCYYDNNPENGKKYGKLYNWYAVNDSRGLAPEGWHIPSLYEFLTFLDYDTIGFSDLKGFSALFAGVRLWDSQFHDVGNKTGFWTSTEVSDAPAAMSIGLSVSYKKFSYQRGPAYKPAAFSVRCIQD